MSDQIRLRARRLNLSHIILPYKEDHSMRDVTLMFFGVLLLGVVIWLL